MTEEWGQKSWPVDYGITAAIIEKKTASVFRK